MRPGRRNQRSTASASPHILRASRAARPNKPRSLQPRNMQPARRRAIFRRLQAANPQPTTELLYSSPFELLVAVMLSAHTTDRSVNAATRKLFPIANTAQAIAALGVNGLRPYLKSVGLYNMKAKNLSGLARQLIEHHGGKV